MAESSLRENTDNDNCDDAFFTQLPKVELHAHLNGSLSPATVVKLIKHHKKEWPHEEMPELANTFVEEGERVTLDKPFVIFPLLHYITDNPEALRITTRDVICDFHQDGVKYLELRSTPREVSGRMSKADYCESIISGITESMGSMDIIVRFLLSIDRRKLAETFDSTVQLYFELKQKYPDLIAGLDISGDPRVGDITGLIPKLKDLRKRGVKLAVHLAEILNIAETLVFLKCGLLDRIGHGTYIHPLTGGNELLLKALLAYKTPVEVCLTSNVVQGTVPSYDVHQAQCLRDNDIPIILCTDDKGVFSCTLSGEYKLASHHFGWDRKVLYQLSLSAIDHIFASDQVKGILRQKWRMWETDNQKYFSQANLP